MLACLHDEHIILPHLYELICLQFYLKLWLKVLELWKNIISSVDEADITGIILYLLDL